MLFLWFRGANQRPLGKEIDLGAIERKMAQALVLASDPSNVAKEFQESAHFFPDSPNTYKFPKSKSER